MTNQEMRDKLNQAWGEWGWMIMTTTTFVEIAIVANAAIADTIAVERTEDHALRTACRVTDERQARKREVTA